MSEKTVVLFSAEHLAKLKEEYAKIKTVDPEGESYKLVCKTLDLMPTEHLEQIAGAGIKFLSSLARNRVMKRRAGR